ncbi:MAG: CopG family transcriptional regulator [Candidatus Nanoarchaeia archaeon]|nr:CopG family transcriptional regulator [Candidatus Nanoarchaeia archaeon]MDD5741432.1 CopG family transcriptional regulator [Candidatus Nanoarchaeia archaeon]
MKKQKENKDNKVEYGTISLPQPLIDKIKLKIHGTGISSVSAYVAFVLRQLLSGESDPEVRSRLKKLGYI